jgi:hypothetical protein
LVARDPSASAGDESSLGSLDALPPATSHGYAEWDFSGVSDPVMFKRFLDATDYWFGHSDDSSAGSYDPARECCVVITNDPANATGATGAGDGELPPALGTGSRLAAGPSAPPPSPPTGADINAQLAQARELEAKLAEEYRTVRLLRASMAGEASTRSERARELGKQARDRINTDFNVDNPDTPPQASQKLIAAATLLRATPAPSTPEAQNLHREYTWEWINIHNPKKKNPIRSYIIKLTSNPIQFTHSKSNIQQYNPTTTRLTTKINLYVGHMSRAGP